VAPVDLGPEDLARALALFARYGKASDVARELGWDVGKTQRILRQHGAVLAPGGHPRELDAEELAAAAAALAEAPRRGAAQVARSLGLPLKATRRALRAAGLIRPRPRVPAAARTEILRVYQETGSPSRAAAAVGVSQSFVHELVRSAGAVRRSTPRWPIRLAHEGAALYRQGFSIARLRAILGRGGRKLPTVDWFARRFRELGILRPRRERLVLALEARTGRNYAELADRACELFAASPTTVAAIARKLGVSTAAVKRWIQRRFTPLSKSEGRRRAYRLSRRGQDARARRVEVLRLRLAGKSYEEIRQAVGASSSTIASWLREAGVATRNPRVPPATVARIRTMAAQGHTYREIAAAVGVAVSTVGKYLLRLRRADAAFDAAGAPALEVAA
jgi:DNA-directed RNA polymerase specialized sigma24 family protein